jgi:hypothetical protein
VVVIK